MDEKEKAIRAEQALNSLREAEAEAGFAPQSAASLPKAAPESQTHSAAPKDKEQASARERANPHKEPAASAPVWKELKTEEQPRRRGQKTRKKQEMSPIQKQAALVSLLCILAVPLTALITGALMLKKLHAPQKPPVSSLPASSISTPPEDEGIANYYQIDTTSPALLRETADGGDRYLEDCLFIGDSNTVRFYNSGLLSLQQYCAREGLGIQGALSEAFVTFKKDSKEYTIPQAIAMMKPRRVILMLGTNDAAMELNGFISTYASLLDAIEEKYPHTDIIVSAIPPVPEDHGGYYDIRQEDLDDKNMALLNLCEQRNIHFLNTAEALKGADGYGAEEYYVSRDIHLKSNGLKQVLRYVTTHMYESEDRRPNTKNIPSRSIEYKNTPSASVTPAPDMPIYSGSTSASSEEDEPEQSSSSSSESGKEVLYRASYQVEQGVGGTLRGENESGTTTKLSYEITDASQSVTVTAVPAKGYLFIKWSDGVTSLSRTDSKFKQNVNVTAVFESASVTLTGSGTAAMGQTYTLRAELKGTHATAENLHWFTNGREVGAAAGQKEVVVMIDESLVGQSFEIYAVVIYNESRVTSNTVKIAVKGAEPTPTPAPPQETPAEAPLPESSAASGETSGSESKTGEPREE